MILRRHKYTLHLWTLIEWNEGLNIVYILISDVLWGILRYLLKLLLLNILRYNLLVLGTNFTIPILYWLILDEISFIEGILVSIVNVSAWKVRIIIWFTGWYGVTYVAVNWMRIYIFSVFLVLSCLHVYSRVPIFLQIVLIHFIIINYIL